MEKAWAKNSDQRLPPPKARREGESSPNQRQNRQSRHLPQIVPTECDSVILTSNKGQVVKLPIASVPRLGRATSGVILMRFTDKSDTIAAATCLTK